MTTQPGRRQYSRQALRTAAPQCPFALPERFVGIGRREQQQRLASLLVAGAEQPSGRAERASRLQGPAIHAVAGARRAQRWPAGMPWRRWGALERPPARPAPPPPAHAATAAARPPGAPWSARHNVLRGRAGRPLRATAGAPAPRARRPPGSGCAGPAPAPRCYPAAGRSLPGAAGCPGDNAAGRRRRTGESARPRHGPAATPPPARARPARLRGAGDTAACSAKPGPAAPPALPANPRGYRRSRRTVRRDGLRWPAPRWRNRVPRAAPGETPEPVRGEARAIRREPARPAPASRARRPGRD